MNALPLLQEQDPALGVLRPLHGCMEKEWGMDVAEGCGASCIHCAGAYAGEQMGAAHQVRVSPGVARRLAEELERLAGTGRRPSRIRLGMASDPLWPSKDVLDATGACLKAAFERGVPVELHTRSLIPDSLLELMKSHPSMLRVVMGVMTVRETSALVYEPGLAPPMGRLRSLRPLVAAGVPVTVRVEPLVPLVNDTEADLEALLDAVARNGVNRVELAYLQLTPQTAKSLSRGLPRMHREMLKGLFATEAWAAGPFGQRKLLPRVLREAGYERAVEVARRFGIQATICACAEPDLKATVCKRGGSIAPTVTATSERKSTPPPVESTAQLGLFAQGLRRMAR
ncbi:MAG: hypothetical protein AB2A00_42095 [Myxococcota bacterium]